MSHSAQFADLLSKCSALYCKFDVVHSVSEIWWNMRYCFWFCTQCIINLCCSALDLNWLECNKSIILSVRQFWLVIAGHVQFTFHWLKAIKTASWMFRWCFDPVGLKVSPVLRRSMEEWPACVGGGVLLALLVRHEIQSRKFSLSNTSISLRSYETLHNFFL